jgi:uncharacterized membrane protein YadS
MLISVGTAICHNSAIVATAPVLDPDEEKISFAVAAIMRFGHFAVLAYPIINCHLMALPALD